MTLSYPERIYLYPHHRHWSEHLKSNMYFNILDGNHELVILYRFLLDLFNLHVSIID